MAADKLCVLRKERECFDIYLLPKDLKVYSKEKRDVFLEGYDEAEDQARLDELEAKAKAAEDAEDEENAEIEEGGESNVAG